MLVTQVTPATATHTTATESLSLLVKTHQHTILPSYSRQHLEMGTKHPRRSATLAAVRAGQQNVIFSAFSSSGCAFGYA